MRLLVLQILHKTIQNLTQSAVLKIYLYYRLSFLCKQKYITIFVCIELVYWPVLYCCLQWMTFGSIEKRSYNRETIDAFNYKIYQMSFITPPIVYAPQIINTFLSSRMSANHDKVERLSANSEILMKAFVSLL